MLTPESKKEYLSCKTDQTFRFCFKFQGSDFPFSPCGRFFNTLPAKHEGESKENLCDALVSNFDYVLNIMTEKVSLCVLQ